MSTAKDTERASTAGIIRSPSWIRSPAGKVDDMLNKGHILHSISPAIMLDEVCLRYFEGRDLLFVYSSLMGSLLIQLPD